MKAEGAAPEAADELAAKALAQVLARHNAASTAVARDPSGNYVVMGYAAWKSGSRVGGNLADWQLRSVAWAAA